MSHPKVAFVTGLNGLNDLTSQDGAYLSALLLNKR